MKQAAVAVGLLLLAAGAASACTTSDYAQYKDRAARNVMSLAREYCLNKDLLKIASDSQARGSDDRYRQCRQELNKIGDAIDTARGKAAAWKYIEQKCPS